MVAALRGQGTKVVDLSADFRLHDLDTYARWYGEHGAPELVSEAVYGLTELHREAIAGAELVANPGCYPTASVLALAPLAAEGLIEDVVIDAKSGCLRRRPRRGGGVGGGQGDRRHEALQGRRPPPYARRSRRSSASSPAATERLRLTFVPHLMPYDQGELVSCYVRTSEPVDIARLLSLYEERYGERAVRRGDLASRRA